MEGWIKLHRQIIENEFYFSEKFTKAQAWIDLILLATHKENTVYPKGVEIRLTPGQLCWSQVSLANRWKWDRKTVRKYLGTLRKRKMVDTKKTNVTTIITIKNWFLYQGDGQRNGQQKDGGFPTNKNVKNNIIEFAKSLIESIKKESSFYAIINKYITTLGEDKLLTIMTDCHKRENTFASENKLAAYLETCKRNNGQLTNHIPEIVEGTPGWM
jgi:DNA replication protein DnaD